MPFSKSPTISKSFGDLASQEKSQTTIEYGLHMIINRSPLSEESVDVVAIHGLNGHYEKTWTDERSGFNWIRDAIPKILPTARITTFEYNSAVQFSKSTSDIYTFGDQLLESLLVVRKSDAEKSRPIIFICHSLGGIVLKQVSP